MNQNDTWYELFLISYALIPWNMETLIQSQKEKQIFKKNALYKEYCNALLT